MKEQINTEPAAVAELTEDELLGAVGGASDYSSLCGMKLSNNCFFCTRQQHGKHTFEDGVTRDTIGCGLSPGYLGNINGFVLVNSVPVPVEG